MDRTTRLETIKKELTELKTKEPKKLESATTKIAELIKKHPELGEDKDLKLMLAFAYLQAGDKILPIVDGAFKTYSGPFEFLQVKRDPKSTLTYLFVALDNYLQKLEKSHNVFVLKKQGPRDVKVAKKDSDGNVITKDGEPVMEERKVLNVTVWVDDMKSIAPVSVWGTPEPNRPDAVPKELVPYEPLQASHAYRMQLNYNGQSFFPAKDPMIKTLENFEPNWTEMVKFMTEKFPEMKEPFDAQGNMDRAKSFFMVGRATKDASGGIIVTPNEPTSAIIQLQRTPDSRLLEDGDDILILGNIGKSKGFTGRDGKEVKPTSDYTIFPDAIVRLSPSQNNGHSENNGASGDHGENKNLKDDLGL